VTRGFVKPGAAVIDIGTTQVTDRALVERLFPAGSKRRDAFDRRGSLVVGDVHPEVADVAGYLSPADEAAVDEIEAAAGVHHESAARSPIHHIVFACDAGMGSSAMGATVLLYFLLRPAQVHVPETRFFELYRTVLRNRSAVAAIISSFLGSLYWFAWVTYIVVFFEQVYGLTRGTASTIALTLGLGVLIGSQVGGRLGDRVGHKPVVATAIVISAFVLLVLTNFDQPLFVAAGLNLILSTVIGARFATNQTLMTEQMPAARGTLLAISGALASLSIVVASSVGGILIDAYGFWAIGIFCFICAVISMLVVLIFVREEPIDVEFAPL